MRRLLVCIMFALCMGGCDQKQSDTPKIAVMLALEGDQVTLGQEAMNGFLLGLQQNDPLEKSDLFVTLMNTKSDPEFAAEEVKRVVHTVCCITGFTDSNGVIAAGKTLKSTGVPLLSIGATDPTLPSRIGNEVFLIPFGDDAQAEAATQYAIKNFGKKSVVLWDNTADYTRGLSKYFRESVTKRGGEILLDLSYPGKCTLDAQIKEIKSLKNPPDFIYLAALPNCVGELVLQLRTHDIQVPIIGGDGFDTENLIADSPDKIDNVWYTTHAWLGDEDPSQEVAMFLDAYKNAYQVSTTSAFAALGYDAARLLIHVVNQAKSNDPKLIMRLLENTQDFHGVTGTISYSKNDHVPKKSVWIIKVTQGELSLADQFIP